MVQIGIKKIPLINGFSGKDLCRFLTQGKEQRKTN
jgi:hypothetical protein